MNDQEMPNYDTDIVGWSEYQANLLRRVAKDYADMQRDMADAAIMIRTLQTEVTKAFDKGAWEAFDTVLAWINTQPIQHIDKKALYKHVFDLRPRMLEKQP